MPKRKKESLIEAFKLALDSSAARKPTKNDGYLYLILSEDQDLAKIGFASNPEARLRQLQTGNGAKLRIDFAIPCEPATEFAVHRVFASRRRTGEWFSGVEHIQDFFCEIDQEFADLQLDEMLNDGTCPNLRPSDIDNVVARLEICA